MTPTRSLEQVPGSARAGALDALRFLAAAFIVLYHFGTEAPVELGTSADVLTRGWLATDFFLILSGYILGRAYGRALDDGRLGASQFILRRIARVWPAQLVVLAGLALLVLVAGAVGVSPGDAARFQWTEWLGQAALIQAWGVTDQAGWNEPSWTLSALIVCYLAFPIAWWGSRRLRGRTGAVLAGLVVLTVAAATSFWGLGHSLFDLPFHQGVWRALPLFALGLLLARFADGRVLGRAASLATCLAAFGALVALQAPERTEATAFASILAIAAIIVAADGLSLPSPAPLKAAADLSFALFISHALVGAVWFGLAEMLGVSDSWIVWGLSLVAALAFALAFHHLIDAPIQRRLRVLLARPLAEPQPDGRFA